MGDVERVKGGAARVIQTPGYRLHSQWDLIHLRHVLEQRRARKSSFHLSLAPMVDMFSILVIYLLMNFSSSGEVYFISKEVTLPRAKSGVPIRSLPLVSVMGANVVFDSEKADRRGNPISVSEANDGQVPRLREALAHLKRIDGQINSGRPFKGEVNLQADRNADVEDIKKVMRVLIEEGWSGINFVVDPRSSGGG